MHYKKRKDNQMIIPQYRSDKGQTLLYTFYLGYDAVKSYLKNLLKNIST